MGRPRKDQEGPSAQARMENAFWELLAEKPFRKITVANIAERAHVNKNAFYYHFGGMQELAEQAISHNLPRAMAAILLSRTTTADIMPAILEADPDIMERVNRIWLIVGPHGSSELISTVKRLVVEVWLELFDVDETKLTHNDRVTIAFALGGMMAVAGDADCIPEGSNPLAVIFGSPMAEAVASSVLRILQSASRGGGPLSHMLPPQFSEALAH